MIGVIPVTAAVFSRIKIRRTYEITQALSCLEPEEA